MFEGLKTSFIVTFTDLIENINFNADDDSENDESDIGQRIRAAKSQLSLLKLEGRESRSARHAEARKVSYELWEKQRNLHRLGKKAQRHTSLYEYAVLMREAGPSRPRPSTSKADAAERLIGKKGNDAEAAASLACTTNTFSPQEPNVTTLILRSQTFYGSSAFLWQIMVQSVLQVRLLKKAHLLTMFKAQQAIFKTHKNEEVKTLAEYIKSKGKMDEACINLMIRKAEIMHQIENCIEQTKQLKETYVEMTRKQRKLILKLRLRGGQAVSDQVKKNIKRRSSLIQGVNDSKRPFLAELKRESKRLSAIRERMSQEIDGPLVEQVRMEFSLDEALIKEDKKRLRKNGRSSPHSNDTSGMGESSLSGARVGFDSNRSLSIGILEEQNQGDESEHMAACNASFVSNSTISDDELDYMSEAVPPQQKKRSRTEFKKSLDALALNRSSRSMMGDSVSVGSHRSNASRSQLEHRRLKAEQRLAKSKRMSQRVSMQAQRQKAKERLEESKKRLQGFLASDDSCALDIGVSRDDGSCQESSTSLKSPDMVANFPYTTTPGN